MPSCLPSICFSTDDSLVLDVEEKEAQRCSLCVSCAAGNGIAADAQATTTPQPPRCTAQEKRDLVLEGMLRWAVDIHFRQCSRLLQASLSRAVCDGIRQALDAAELSSARASPPRFPLGCRLLLSFVGGLKGDGGAQAASFLQERCGTELRLFLALARCRPFAIARGKTSTGGRVAAGVPARRHRRRPELPVLDAYVGHLCLCRHVSDALASRHLDWLARQALIVLRLVDGDNGAGPSGGVSTSGDMFGALISLSHAVALLLTRPKRGQGVGGGSAGAVTEVAGNLLEIVFDSDVRPLSGVPTLLAEAAVDALKAAGHLQLARPDELLRPPRTSTRPDGPRRGLSPNMAGYEPPGAPSSSSDGASFAEDVDFRRASVAFRSSWSLAAAGLDAHLPVLENRKKRLDSGDLPTDDGDSDSDSDDEPVVGNGWGRVPDEVALRVFSFLTPKRVCRLACVDRAWREMLMVPRVWRPFFEARWPVTVIESEEDRARVSERLLLEGSGVGLASEGGVKRKKKRRRGCVVRWRLPEVSRRYCVL